MAFLAAAGPAISAIGGLLGIATSVKSLISKNQKPSAGPVPIQPQMPKQPTQADASQKAAEAVKKRQRVSLLSGGKTNITRGKALVSQEELPTKSLVGA